MISLLPLIRKNVLRNFPGCSDPTKPGSNISVQELDWLALYAAAPSFRPQFLTWLPNPADLILVVDCIYHPSLLPALVETIDILAVPDKTAVLVVVELRAADVVREFLELWMKKGGWELWRIGGGLMAITYAMWVGRKRAAEIAEL
jgi:hypothetical protein